MSSQPLKSPPAPKRVSLNMKATPDFRAKIAAAADRSGLSIAQEVERRLLASIAEDERADSPEEAQFLRNARRIMDRISDVMQQPWTQDHDAWGLVRSGLLYLLAEIEPEPLTDSLAEQMSETEHAAVETFEQEHKEWRARQYAAGTAAAEAYLALHAADDDQDKARVDAAIAAAEAAGAEPEPQPKLRPSLLPLWKARQERRALVERATAGLVAVIPKPSRGRGA